MIHSFALHLSNFNKLRIRFSCTTSVSIRSHRQWSLVHRDDRTKNLVRLIFYQKRMTNASTTINHNSKDRCTFISDWWCAKMTKTMLEY